MPKLLLFLLGLFAALLLLILTAAYVCCRLAFAAPKNRPDSTFDLPDSEQVVPFAPQIRQMIREAAAIPFEEVAIPSFDQTPLFGRVYPAAQADAPWLILFHGYRSAALRDFCEGLPFGLAQGCHVLLVDQRAHGKSGGKFLTMGVLERHDCRAWIRYIINRSGPQTKIILYGLSMGAATVLMAADSLPAPVVGIVADCGYSSPEKILKKVIRDLRLPLFPTYPLLRLGARLFGGFDPRSASAEKALASYTRPLLLLHGEDDRFVPCAMSRALFAACPSEEKTLLTFPRAGHGLSYFADPKAYRDAVAAFFEKNFSKSS